MAFIFMVLGVLAGALVGNIPGALFGGGLGFWLGKRLAASNTSTTPDLDSNAAPVSAPEPSPPPAAQLAHVLERRVQALEQQVADLQTKVAGLSAPSVPDTDNHADTPIAAEQAAPAPAMPLAAASVLSAIQTVAVPAPPDLAPIQASALPEPASTADQADWAWPDTDPASAIAHTADLPEAPVKATPEPIAAPRALPPRPAPKSFQDYVPTRLQPLIFGGNTIVKVGVLILFLGLAFLLSYVAEQVTVPIEMRYAGVALLGAGLLGLGWRLRDKRDASGSTGYGLVLQGAGIGVFYLTTLAAMKLHPLLPLAAGFAIMVVVTAFGAMLAVAQNAPWLAMVASAAGFATPVLVSTGSGNHIALFSYLAILDLGIMAIAWFKAWRPLNLIGFVGTFTLAAAWAGQHYTEALYPSTQAFLLLFFLMFTAIGVLFARRALALGDEPDARHPLADRAMQALRQVGRVDSTLVFGVPLTAYGLQYQMLQHDPWLPALSALVMGLFYVVLGRALWRGAQSRYALLGEAYVVVGVLFGTLSIPLALEGVWTGATWAVEAAGMYWLGTRQHRTYTRAFALALMAAAAARTLSSLGLDASPAMPLITGSQLGMGLLAGSALAMALVHRRATHNTPELAHPEWEKAGALGTWCLAVLAFAILPWMVLTPTWASVSMALMAVGCMALADRATLPVLRACAVGLHAAALCGFASTLHQLGDQAMLANGLEGLTAAVLIGLSLLFTAWLSLRDTWRQATDPSRDPSLPPEWSWGSSAGVLAGLGLVSGALLFMMPLGQAALVWPLVGLLSLWLGLKLAHPALCLMWAGLTAASALAFLAFGPALWPALSAPETAAPWQGVMGGLAWWTPLVLAVSALVSGAWLNSASRRTEGWRMPWTSDAFIHVGIVGWSLLWWTQTWLPEAWRHLHAMHLLAWWPACLALWVTASSVLMVRLAQWRSWPLMGQAAGLTIPAWWWAALLGPVFTTVPPSAHLGWMAWPLALLWHPLLLRRSAAWWSDTPQRWMHVTGFWLFAALAMRQVQWATDQWMPPGSAWQALGWVLVPLALVAAVSRSSWQARWPLKDFGTSYRLVACLPLVLMLLAWLTWSAFNAGQARPLPYLPVLNPLELGQGLVLLSLAGWVRVLPAQASGALPAGRARLAALGAIGFVMLTAMVLRTCHHWAGVPWEGEALFHSTLTQAALSVTWALLGVGLMLKGHRQVQRTVWTVGAALLGVVVAKLFFIELADRGGLYRIVSFIAVGLLLLLVGYFAPVPPQRPHQESPR